MNEVVISGVGSTKFGKHDGVTAIDLATDASLQAIVESELDMNKIGAIYLGNFVSGFLTGQEVLAGLWPTSLASVACRQQKWRALARLVGLLSSMPVWLFYLVNVKQLWRLVLRK